MKNETEVNEIPVFFKANVEGCTAAKEFLNKAYPNQYTDFIRVNDGWTIIHLANQLKTQLN